MHLFYAVVDILRTCSYFMNLGDTCGKMSVRLLSNKHQQSLLSGQPGR